MQRPVNGDGSEGPGRKEDKIKPKTKKTSRRRDRQGEETIGSQSPPYTLRAMEDIGGDFGRRNIT